MHNFTVTDIAATLFAFLLFSLFLFVPGYAIGWLLDLFSFRRRTLPFRLTLCIPLSISVCPIAIYFVERFGSPAAVWVMYGLAWLYSAILLVGWLRAPRIRDVWRDVFGQRAALFAIIGIWITLAVASLIDLQWGNRLYNSVIALDYSVRAAFIDSITRTGIPPALPNRANLASDIHCGSEFCKRLRANVRLPDEKMRPLGGLCRRVAYQRLPGEFRIRVIGCRFQALILRNEDLVYPRDLATSPVWVVS
jgi:hypothetical protein